MNGWMGGRNKCGCSMVSGFELDEVDVMMIWVGEWRKSEVCGWLGGRKKVDGVIMDDLSRWMKK